MQTTTLAEAQSKRLLAGYGMPIAEERVVGDVDAAVAAAAEIGFPVVAKLNGDGIAHKTERGLVRLNLASVEAVRDAARALLDAATPADGHVDLIIASQVRGNR